MSKLLTTELANITTAQAFGTPTTDLRLFTAIRAHRTGGSDLIIGGQTGNTLPNLKSWNDANHPGSWHSNKPWFGWWAGEGQLLHACADGLQVDGADGMTVDPGTPLTARWGVRYNQVEGPLKWAYRFADASDGSVIASGTQIVNQAQGTLPLAVLALPALDEDQSALLWVRLADAVKKYSWPADYAAVTGRAALPLEYQWSHPETGAIHYFDPEWVIGAMPFAGASAQGDALLAQFADNAANGRLKKNPDWVSLLVTFEADGTPTPLSGEWASLAVVAGEWIGNQNVSLVATPGPALWKDSGAGVVPWLRDPQLRSVGALYIEPESGDLWAFGSVAGASGPELKIARYRYVDGAWVEQEAGYGDCAHIGICEAALFSQQTGLDRYPDKPLDEGGVMRALVTSDRLVYDPSKPARERLSCDHPGGRSAFVLYQSGDVSRETYGYISENDFASNPENDHHSFGYLVYRDGRQWRSGRGVAHHVDSSAGVYGDAVYFIEELPSVDGVTPYAQTAEQRLQNRQYLTKWNGAGYSRLYAWGVSTFDGARVGRAGDKLVIFGQESVDRAPRVMRLRGTKLTATPATCDYYAWRLQTTLSADRSRENVLIVGQKFDSEAGAAQAGWCVAETSGTYDSDATADPEAPANGHEAWDHPDRPAGATVWVEEIEFSGPAVSCFLNDINDTLETIYEDFPFSLWLRIDGETPFPDAPGDAEPTTEMLAQMEEFKVLARPFRELWLPKLARTKIEVMYILPPGTDIVTANHAN